MKTTFFHVSVVMMLVALASGAVSCGKSTATATDAATEKIARQAVLVRTSVLQKRTMHELLQVNGTLEAKNKAVISSRVSGTIAQVNFDLGDAVKAGDVLFRIDDRSYRDAVDVAKATLAAQQSAVKVAEANLSKAQAELHKADIDAQRFKRLYDAGNASSNEFETYKLNQERAKSSVDYAQAYLQAQIAQVSLAESTLAIKQKDLEDTVIRAPFDGRIAARLHDPGEEVGARTSVFSLIEPDTVRAVMSLPSEYYGRIELGKTEIQLQINGKRYRNNVKITSKSPSIETGLRTFEVKAEFANDEPELLVPGALLAISIQLSSHEAFAVPLDVPIKRNSGVLLFAVEDNKAHAVPVTTGIEEAGWVEVTGKSLASGMTYITDGQFQIEDGTPLRIAQ